MILYFVSDEDEEEMREILDNLHNICSLREGSMPMSRGMGLSWAMLDAIAPDAENDLVTELVDKVNRFEPRASVESVTFKHSDDGEMIATIEIERIRDGNY